MREGTTGHAQDSFAETPHTLHDASPAPLDPATFTHERAAASCGWCRAVPLSVATAVTALILGADMSAAIGAAHATGAVPVVIVREGVAVVEPFERPRAS